MRTDLKLLIAVADEILALPDLPLSTGSIYKENDIEATDFTVNGCPLLASLTHNKTKKIHEAVEKIATDNCLNVQEKDPEIDQEKKRTDIQKISNIARTLLLLGKSKLLMFKNKLKRSPDGTDELLQVILKTTHMNPKFVRNVIMGYVKPPKLINEVK